MAPDHPILFLYQSIGVHILRSTLILKHDLKSKMGIVNNSDHLFTRHVFNNLVSG